MFIEVKTLFAGAKAPLPVTPERKRLSIRLERMIGLLREAMGEGMPEKFADVLRTLAERSGDIERGLVVWVRLIEVLTQNAERGFGDSQGQLKKADVKAAIHHILTSNRFEIPQIPTYLTPVILDFAVDWTIEIIVSETNRYGLWAADPPEPHSLSWAVRMAIKKLKHLLRPVIQLLARLFAWIYVRLQYYEPLSPELNAAVEAVEAEGFFIDKRDFLKTTTETVIFIGGHGPQVIALFQLVFEAVREAELYVNLSGPQKKEYARDIIQTVLAELGFPVDSGLIGMIIRSFIDGAIESAVDVFSRRAPEMFPHRQKA